MHLPSAVACPASCSPTHRSIRGARALSTISVTTISPSVQRARYTAPPSRSRERDATGRRPLLPDDVDPVAEHVGTVVQSLQPALVGAGAQQVIGRGEREAGQPGQLLGAGPTGMLGEDLEQPECALDRLDE